MSHGLPRAQRRERALARPCLFSFKKYTYDASSIEIHQLHGTVTFWG